MIHGDPVLSNIIKKNNEDLVFLDPRGGLGENFAMCGDINYDFAKIYQSLYGYENIILDKKIDHDYLKVLRSHFENLIMSEKKNKRYLCSKIFNIKSIFFINKFSQQKIY